MTPRAWAGCVVVALAGVSLGSIGLFLLLAPSSGGPAALGEERSYGGFDPHLHFEVVDVAAASEPSGSERRIDVRVAVRSDATRIVVDPTRFRVAVLEGTGAERAPRPIVDPDGGGNSGVRFDHKLEPGESYTREFSFTVPADAGKLQLVLRRDGWLPSRLPRVANRMIGTELAFDLE